MRLTEQSRVLIRFRFLLRHKDVKYSHPSDQVKAGDA